MYRPPSSPSSVRPPGKARWASSMLLPFELASLALRPGTPSDAWGPVRRRNRISGRARGLFTQSYSKNWARVDGGVCGLGTGWVGEGTTRMTIATAARRGSERYRAGFLQGEGALTGGRGGYNARGGGADAVECTRQQERNRVLFF